MKTRLTRFLSLILAISNCLLLTAQDKTDLKQIRLKLYVNALHEDIKSNGYAGFLEENVTYKSENKKYDIGTLSFAIEFGSLKKIKHEFELMPLKLDQNDILEIYTLIEEIGKITTVNTDFTRSFKTACRYQANFYIIQNKYLMPYIGLSSQSYYKSVRNIHWSSEYEEKNLGLLFAIAPGIIFNINEKISIDLNVPVDIYNVKFTYEERRDYPRLSKTSRVDKEFTPETINLRLGICYKL